MNNNIKGLIVFFLNSVLFSLYIGLTSFTSSGKILLQTRDTSNSSAFKFKTVVIDAGHGGKDPGAHGAYSKEKNVALAIAKKLRTSINKQLLSINTVMTRSTDEFIELHRRDDIASEHKGNLFISIHCNASPEKVCDDRGVLLLVYGYHRKEAQLEAIREN